MSAIRSSASTRAQRSYSPYGRPRPKKSTWSFSSLFSIFNPLRSASSQDTDAQSESGSEPEDFDSPEPESTSMQQSTPAHALADVGHRMSQNIASTPQWASMPPPPPPPAPSAGPSTLPFPPSSESPEKNIEYVAEFLRGKQDGLISEADRNKLVSLLSSSSRQLQQSSPTIREPFRFTHSPSPMRGNTPLPTTNPSPHDRSASPTKMLAKNPNGSYRWNGGGSAKKRTRYQSPAFAPTRSASEQLVLRPSSTDASKTDTKRRRVSISTVAPPAQPASSSASPNTPIRSSRSPAPDPSPTRIATSSIIPVTGPMSPSRSMSSINGNSAPKPNALALSASTSRLSASTRFTTPVVPSPLRQAWGQASPGSVSSSSPDTTPQKQTKAANLMAELIKDATPSRNMDISNPYQSASPARPGRPKRNRITAKPPPPARRAIEEVKKSPEPPLTAHAIIEATVPKGSKRSRPPPSAKTNGHPAITNGHQNYDEDEDERANKKTKPSELERVDTDISMESTSAKTSSTSTLGSFTSRPVASKAFPIPKEPSKLRYSFQPDTPPTPTPETVSSPAPPVVPTSAPPPPAADTPSDPKSEAAKVPVNDLPKYDFARCMVPTTSVSCDKATWEEVYIMADEELPSYDFSVRKTFDFKAAGMKAPEASGKWTCSQCCLENDNAAAEKCVICEAPRESKSAPAPPPPPPASGEAKVFDWAAAGLEAPRRSADAWTCSVCSLGNTGGSKCFICDSPRV